MTCSRSAHDTGRADFCVWHDVRSMFAARPEAAR